MKQIAILMATYNGSTFIEQQIESLFAQTYANFSLYIHDDGSTDDTLDILHRYESKNDNVHILNYPSLHNAKDNFLSMTQKVAADYYFFCDQDDIWHNEKIAIEMLEMEKMENLYGDIPLLVFSDLRVVDNNLNLINNSLWQCGGVCPDLLSSFDAGAVFEYVTGCTMLFNKRACDSIIYPAKSALMHDSWTTYCILKAGGIVKGIPTPLVSYRQHNNNSLGATKWSSYGICYKIIHLFKLFSNNYKHWKSLDDLHYGSFIKYLKYKYFYRYFVNGKKL